MTEARRITETGQAYNALFHKPFILSIIRLPPFSYTPGLGHELVPVLLINSPKGSYNMTKTRRIPEAG